MVAHPPTLIHGSFRPYHIIVSGESQLMRVCACDWERAAFGAPLYDLAYLTDGFKAPTLDAPMFVNKASEMVSTRSQAPVRG